MPNSYDIIDHSFDVVVLGAGGAGLRATLGMVAAGLILGCVAGLVSVIRVAFAAERATSKGESADAGKDAGSDTKQ